MCFHGSTKRPQWHRARAAEKDGHDLHDPAADGIRECARAFREEDSAFFGHGSTDDRQSAIGQLMRWVREHGLAMVGSGKCRSGAGSAARVSGSGMFIAAGAGAAPGTGRRINSRANGTDSAAYASDTSVGAELLGTGTPESHMARQELNRSTGKPDPSHSKDLTIAAF